MIMLQRKVRAKYTGEEQYKPENVPAGKFVPVIGIEVTRGETYRDGKPVVYENLFYHVIDNKGKLVKMASFNCVTIIDEAAELNGGHLIQMMSNLTTMMKVLSEKICAVSGNQDNGKPEEESGEKTVPSA